LVFIMTRGTLTAHISGIDVAESVLERNERLVRLMIERNANLPSTRSQPSIKFTSRRDSGVGYKPVPVVGGDKHPVVGIGIVDGVPRVAGGEISGAGWFKEVVSCWNYISESWSSPFFLLCTFVLHYYLKTKLLEDIDRLIKEALRRADVLLFIDQAVRFRYYPRRIHGISAKSHSSSTEHKSPSLRLT